MARQVILAYSGGLDTTVVIPWLKEKQGIEVVAVLVDAGRSKDLERLRRRALEVGAADAVVVDGRRDFADRYLTPALHANALYEGKYPLVSALSRPLICEALVEEARRRGADAIAHGCTGKGNDQVRFALSIWALAPDLEVLAPIRDWGMSREEAIAYAEERGIPIPVTKTSPYSIDQNLWGRTIECGVLEDPWIEPPEDIYEVTVSPLKAPAEPAYVEVEFEEGRPVALDGERMGVIELLERLDALAGSHGFGRLDMVENRLVGIKSREIYEVPGALALIQAHRELESLVLERDLLHFKPQLEQRYAELVYNGQWFSPLKRSLDAFFAATQETVTGTVRLKFYRGSSTVVGRKSEFSLYDYSLATYDRADAFSHSSAAGFTELWGLPIKVWAKKRPRATR